MFGRKKKRKAIRLFCNGIDDGKVYAAAAAAATAAATAAVDNTFFDLQHGGFLFKIFFLI